MGSEQDKITRLHFSSLNFSALFSPRLPLFLSKGYDAFKNEVKKNVSDSRTISLPDYGRREAIADHSIKNPSQTNDASRI
jgi:hypothetical protein